MAIMTMDEMANIAARIVVNLIMGTFLIFQGHFKLIEQIIYVRVDVVDR